MNIESTVEGTTEVCDPAERTQEQELGSTNSLVVSRDPASGKFVKKEGSEFHLRKKSSSQRAVSNVADVMEMKVSELEPLSADSAHVLVLKRVLKDVLEAGPEEMGNKAKVLDLLHKAIGVYSAPAEELQPIRVVVFTAPNVPEGIGHEHFVKPTKPSWVDAEVVQQNAAPPQEADEVETELIPEPAVADSSDVPAEVVQRQAESELARTGGLFRPLSRQE